MAYDIKLTKEWDLPVHMTLIDNTERVAQQIKITLGFWKGEWFLNTQQGVPYLERIIVKNPNASHIRQVLQEQIASVDGVTRASVDSVLVDQQSRTAEVIYSAETDRGKITEEVSIYGR